jgi:hypothetical protein
MLTAFLFRQKFLKNDPFPKIFFKCQIIMSELLVIINQIDNRSTSVLSVIQEEIYSDVPHAIVTIGFIPSAAKRTLKLAKNAE